MTPIESQAKPNPAGHICDRQGHSLYRAGEWIKCRFCSYTAKAGKR